jgi:hypothetical protein
MKTLTAEKEFTRIQRHAENIRNDEPHAVETASAGDMWAQGDIGLVCLASVPKGATLVANPSAKLAPGTTQGSRHILSDMTSVRLHRLKDATPLDGPVIDAPRGCTVTHPEHGDVSLPPGVYGVIYQRAFADELRRVQD